MGESQLIILLCCAPANCQTTLQMWCMITAKQELDGSEISCAPIDQSNL
jgi:hypothetical protein